MNRELKLRLKSGQSATVIQLFLLEIMRVMHKQEQKPESYWLYLILMTLPNILKPYAQNFQHGTSIIFYFMLHCRSRLIHQSCKM